MTHVAEGQDEQQEHDGQHEGQHQRQSGEGTVAVFKLSTESLTGSQILNAICEINGRFGHIDRDGKFAYIKLEQNIQGLYPAVDLYPSPTLYPQKPKSTPIASGSYIPPLKYEKYNVPSITRLQIRTDDSDIGVVVGTVGTDYVIQGNFLAFNLDATALTGIATNILGEISGVIFQPFEVQMRANLCFEVGDAIRCNDDLTGVEGYILYRNAVGIQAIIDTLNCMKERDYKLDANSVGYQFNAVNNRTASIRTDVDEVSATLTYQLDPTAGEPGGTHNSYAYQTAQQIGAKVETTTYNNFVNNTYATFVTQTNSSLTAKAEKTVGNFTTGFSCTLDTTGHTWYKDNQQVMKIDGNGLTVTGKIVGSEFICGSENSPTAQIKSSGDYMIIGGSLALFDAEHSGQYTISFNTDEFEMSTTNEIDMMIYDAQALYATSNYISEDDRYETRVCLGCDDVGDFQANKVAINGSDWVHVGVSSPSIHIGGTGDSGSTDICIQAQSDSNIVFKYGTTSVTTKTLAGILNDISSASSSASDAYTLASGIINNMLPGIVVTLNNHEQRITALENA